MTVRFPRRQFVRLAAGAAAFPRRRAVLGTLSAAAVGPLVVGTPPVRSAVVSTDISKLPPYGNSTLPQGIRSRLVNNINGLTMHVLEAGYEVKGQPCVLLLHGFPELAYSWRKVMLPLASADITWLPLINVATDVLRVGMTRMMATLTCFRLFNLVRDALRLTSALGYRSVAAVIGHDFGSPVAAYCAVIRPDVFHSVALMSARSQDRRDCRSIPSVSFRRLSLLPHPAFSKTSRGSILPGSTTRNIIEHVRPMITCGRLHRASTLSCVPIIT